MKIVVIDDDPTGSQVVHNCPLLLRWDLETLRRSLRHPSDMFFLLANTRALAPYQVSKCIQLIVARLDEALKAEGLDRRDVFLVSRGDSTLRGHGVLEPRVLSDAFGPFDATFHCPAFLEGGRTTVHGIHYLYGNPVHTTPFAHDTLFGYSTSHLPTWLEEKSCGAISANKVDHLDLSVLDTSSSSLSVDLVSRLRSLKDNTSVIVDAESYDHLNCFASAVRSLSFEKRFLFRSAASLIKSLAPPSSPLYSPSGLASLRLRDKYNCPRPGFVIVGSYVPLADQQLAELLSQSQCVGIELSVHQVARVSGEPNPELLLSGLLLNCLDDIRFQLRSGKTPVLFTSRGQLLFDSISQSRRFSILMASLMARLASSVASDLGYLISKGGTTTQTLLSEGLSLNSVHLEGQLLPGLSMVRPTEGSCKGLPIITFPGNLGSPQTLKKAWQLMEAS